MNLKEYISQIIFTFFFIDIDLKDTYFFLLCICLILTTETFLLITGRLRNNLSSGYEPLPKFIRKHILQPIIFFYTFNYTNWKCTQKTKQFI